MKLFFYFKFLNKQRDNQPFTLHTAQRGHAQTNFRVNVPIPPNCSDYNLFKCTVVYKYFTLIKTVENYPV